MGRNRHNNQQRAQRRQRPPAGLQLVSPRTGIATTQGALAVASNADPNANAERRGDVSLLFAERGATGGGSAAFQQQQYAAAQAQMAYSTRVNQAQGMWNPTGKPYPQMPEVPDNKPLLQAMGATGTAIFSGIIASEEYNSDFYWKDAIAIYEQMMRNDAQVFATINLMEEPIRRCTWSIEPASDDPVDMEIASFIESCLFHDMVMKTTEGRTLTQKWDDILRHILMSFRFGFSAFEQVWRIEDGWVKWARWEPLLPRTVWRWWVGDDNQLVGIQQWTFKNYSYRFIDIPADKLLLFVHRQEGNNYDGVSVLRSAYKHWWYKQNFEKIEAIDIERNAVAVPVIGLPESFSNADVTAAGQILANLRANQSMGVTLPPGWTFEYARNFAKTTTQVQPSIQYHDVMIARNILGQFLNLGSTEAGSYALAATHLDLFRSLLQAEVEWIEDVINTDAIPRLCDYNYDGIAVYPKLKASKIAAQDVGVITDALSKLCNMPTPLITPGPEIEDFLRKELGLPSAPASQIEGTNPTQEQEPPEDEEGDGEGDEGEDENTTQESTSTSGRPVASAPGTGDEGPAGTSEGISGMLLREQVREARLLRETLDAAYGQDAVERGVNYALAGHPPGYTQNRGAGGRWAPGDGGAAGGGAGAGGAGARAGRGAARAAGGNRVRAARGAGAAGGGRQRQGRQRQQQPKVVKVEDVAKANKVKQRENEKVRKAAVGQQRKDLAAARKKEGEEKAKYRQAQKDAHAAYKAHRDALKAARQQIDAQRGPNRLRGNQGWAREENVRNDLARQAPAVKAAKREEDAKGHAYFRAEHAYHVAVGMRVIAENRFNNAAQNIPGLKAAPKTADIQARMKTRNDAQMQALRQQALHDADHAVIREENGHWTGDKALEPPFSAEQFGRANLVPLGARGINTSYTATIGGRKYLIKEVQPQAVMRAGSKVDNPERYETHAEAASVRIAEEMGMGGHVVHGTYAFEHGGKQYVAVQWKAGMKPLGFEPARVQAFTDKLSEAQLRDMWLHEYVVAEPDRHGGNYLFNANTGKAFEIDHGRSLRLDDLAHNGGVAEEAWANKVGAGHFAFNRQLTTMHFDRTQLERIVSAEPRILATMNAFHLQAGEDGVRGRLSVLRDLAKVADPTMKDFNDIVNAHRRVHR